MATADELLATSELVDKTLTANLDTRVIVVPASITVLGVEADDDVHRLQFSIPRYYGEFDLSEFNIHINYENARRQGDVYPVDDLALSDAEDEITFSWLVDRYAFLYAGDVNFSICMKKYDGDTVVKEFNTTFATLPVLEGLETSEAIIESNPGLFERVLMRLYAVETAIGLGAEGNYTTVKMEQTDDGVALTLLDREGETTAVITNGKDGVDGAAGYTPIKGVDYYTTADKAEFKTYIDTWSPDSIEVTLTASAWAGNLQTVNVDGVTSDSIVMVSPEPSSTNYTTYNDSEIRCVGQGEGTLTFRCEFAPSTDVIANVAIYYSTEEVSSGGISTGSLSATDDGTGNVTITIL